MLSNLMKELMVSTSDTKADVQSFWGSLYASVYGHVDGTLTREGLLRSLDDLEDLFRLRGHMAVVEMPLLDLKGKSVLEIGPGAGGHSSLFAKYGAAMTSIDITEERARATQAKFDLMGASTCQAMQGDAENLPFADATFDIVYSNGVLHHTPDTEKAFSEVYRVLKPGGRTVVMLYCKSSWHYWINLYLCVGLLMGRAFGDKNWLGKATEWGGRNKQTVENPVTRCYTARGIRQLFYAFENTTMRKREFYLYLIPKLGKLYRKFQIRYYGTHPGGLLVYGEPWPKQSALEKWLGPLMGWAWYVTATKPRHHRPGGNTPGSGTA